MPRNFHRLGQRISEILPRTETALQWTHALNSQLLQFLCHPGTRRFARSSTVENDLLILGQYVSSGSDIIGQHADGAGQCPRIGH
jgi:hypothetical protein